MAKAGKAPRIVAPLALLCFLTVTFSPLLASGRLCDASTQATPDGVVATCRSALSRDPASVEKAYSLGRALKQAENYSEAASIFRRLADQGHASAMNELAKFHVLGLGVDEDIDAALRLFRRAAEAGHAAAQTNLGYLHASDRHGLKDPKESAFWYKKAADQGEVLAQYRLGRLYQNGIGVDRDHAEAARYYEAAAAQGHVRATYRLGLLYDFGSGVGRNDKKAARLYRAAADKDDTAAMRRLAYLHRWGEGAAYDELKAYVWLSLAAAAGDERAFMDLSELAQSELRVQDPVRSEAATDHVGRNDADLSTAEGKIAADEFLSQHADLALKAISRTANERFAEASDWLVKSADAGLDNALLRLGNLHLSADALERKPSSIEMASVGAGSAQIAAEYYQQAVDDGSVAARINLAALYELGHGVERDPSRAKHLYQEAVGEAFDAPARIGLLRLDLSDRWSGIAERLDALGDRLEATAGANASDITITALDSFVSFKVTDRVGRRYYQGDLIPGQSMSLPKSAEGKILWASPFEPPANVFSLRVSGKEVDLPSEGSGQGIRLDRDALLRGDDYVIPPPNDYETHPRAVPEAVRTNSRITLAARSRVSIYVYGEDNLFGFQETLDSGDRFHVPAVAGLVLEMRPAGYNKSDSGRLNVIADGEFIHELIAPRGCVATLALAAAKLRSSRRQDSLLEDCSDLSRDTSVPVLKAADGSVLGKIAPPPDTSIAGRTDFVLDISRDFFVLQLRLAGRWDEYLRALKIVLHDHLRDSGPYSYKTIETALMIAEFEAEFGDPANARARLDQALERLDTIGTIPDEIRANLHLRLASVLSKLGRAAEAEKFLYLAAAYRMRHNLENGRPRLENIAGIYGSLAEAAARLGRLEDAITLILRQHLINSTVELQSDEKSTVAAGPALIARLIEWLRVAGRDEVAAKLLPELHRQAKTNAGLRDASEPLQFPLDLNVFENFAGPADRSQLVAGALGTLGRAYSWMNRQSEALPLLEQEVRTLSNIYGDTSPQSTAALAELANVLRLNGDNGEALARARAAWDAAIAHADSRGGDPREAISASVDAIEPAGMALLAALDEHGGREAAVESFEIAQRLQNSATAVAMHALNSRLSAKDVATREFLRRRQDLAEELVRLDRELFRIMSGTGIGKRKKREEEARRQISKVEYRMRELDTSLPEAVAAIDELARASAIPATEVDDMLSDDEALILYVLSDSSTYVWTMTRQNGLRWNRLSTSGYELGRQVQALRASIDPTRKMRGAMSIASRPASRNRDQLDLAYHLHEALIAPIADDIAEKKNLLIVANGALTSLPFHALVAEDPGEEMSQAKPRDAAWLVKDYAVSILPSVASMKVLRPQSTSVRARRAYVGVGNPAFAPSLRKGAAEADAEMIAATQTVQSGVPDLSTFFRGGLARPEALAALDPLPDTAEEIRAVAASLGAPSHDIKLMLGPEAVEGALKSAALDEFRIIHFATHGLVSGELEGLSEPALVLTPPDRPSAHDDGLLTASEVAQLRLNADWVILSACNTAGGGTPGAEALSGLARAFFYAGARAALVSHWPVVSSAAVELTTGTFNAMAKDPSLGRAQALREAMLELIDSGDPMKANPFYWAPFTIVGATGSL